MAHLTPLPLDEARAVGARYGLDVGGVRPVLAGSVNSNFELSTAGGGRVFLRVFEEQESAPAAREAALLDHLCGGRVATPRPLRLEDGSGFVTEHRDKPVCVFPWVDGEIACQARVTAARAGAVGIALARVHLAGAGFEGAPPTRFGRDALAKRLDALPAAALAGPVGEAAAILGRELGGLRPEPPERAPVIHGDLFRDNVLWTPDDPDRIAALLDFESASRGLWSFDLMVTVLAWCFGDTLEHELARAMVSGYGSVRPLLPDDRAELFDQGRFAAIRFAITRITDFELRPRESGVYKDYRRFLGRLASLDALGPGGLASALGLG